MKNIAIIANTILFHIKFNRLLIDLFLENDLNLHIISNMDSVTMNNNQEVNLFRVYYSKRGVTFHDIQFDRNPLEIIKHIKSANHLKAILLENQITLVHTHTPIPSLIVRLVSSPNVKILYTAHGFHFHSSSSVFSWLLYFPIEYLSAKRTDQLFVINNEDLKIANKMPFKSISFLKGAGVDTKKFNSLTLQKNERPFTFVSVAELNQNKNHEVVLKALSKLNGVNFCYKIVGNGEYMSKLKFLTTKYGIEDNVVFYGYLEKPELVLIDADIFVLPSFREGLPISLIEAMSSGLPVIASNIRGINDLVVDGLGGYLFNPRNWKSVFIAINKILENELYLEKMGKYNQLVSIEYDSKNVTETLRPIYQNFIQSKKE